MSVRLILAPSASTVPHLSTPKEEILMDERDEQVETADVEETAETEQELVVADELLVEDVSIDGMCGVY